MATTPRVLVLGGTGIIGQALVNRLTEDGRRVDVVSRHVPDSLSNLPPGVRHIRADARQPTALTDAIAATSYEAVVDLVSFDASQAAAAIAAIGGATDQYVFVSSATVFDASEEGQPITETHALMSHSWRYPALKIAAERTVSETIRLHRGHSTIVRPYITYSPRRIPLGIWESGEVLSRIQNGRPLPYPPEIAEQLTSVTDTRDLARAISGLVGNNAAADEDFNVATPASHTWMDIISSVASPFGREPWWVPTTLDDISAVLPHMRGKLEDRALQRAFDMSKLTSAIPGFTFDYSVPATLSGYVQDLAARSGIREPHPAMTARLDWLAHLSGSGSQVASERRAYARALRRTDPRAFAQYVSRYHPVLRRGIEIAKATLRSTGAGGDYR